jgi:hypothetical protein
MIKTNQMWTGYNMVKKFYQPDGSIKEFGNVCWFTNMPTTKRVEEIILTKNFNTVDYPQYDNNEAIEVSKVINIPKNYKGVMGVPITFLDKYNPEQFEVLSCSAFSDPEYFGCGALYVGGKKTYARILIQSK